MITGAVNASREAIIKLVVRGPSGAAREFDAVIDTGFNDELTLPANVIDERGLPYAAPSSAALAGGQVVEVGFFRAAIVWDGRPRQTLVIELAGIPLVGMGLLDGYRLTLDAISNGRIQIEALPLETGAA